MSETLSIGTFNIEYGRDPEVVSTEIEKMFRLFGLAGLCVQEAAGYYPALNHLPFANYFADASGSHGDRLNGILVGKNHKARLPRYNAVGTGWTVGGGVKHDPSPLPRVWIDWLRVASGHWPSDTDWVSGRVHAPEPRLDDVEAQAKQAVRFLKTPGPRAYFADFNEEPGTSGLYTPSWVAEKAKAKIVSPDTPWDIDYALFKGCKVVSVRKYRGFSERSDHDLVVVKFARS